MSIFIQILFSAEVDKNESNSDLSSGVRSTLGRVGDYGFPNNPQYDRAKGYLFQGKVQNAVSNSGNFITWDHHPAGFWGEYGYLPHVGFVAGVPGHEYSSKWSTASFKSWIQDGSNGSIWYSQAAYEDWFEDSSNPLEDQGKYKAIVYNTVVDRDGDDRGHNDRGDIAVQLVDYCDSDFCKNINNCDDDNYDYCIKEQSCIDLGYDWYSVDSLGIDLFDLDGKSQWFFDHGSRKIYLFLDDATLDPNFASSGIGFAFPWSIRPKFSSRSDKGGGFYLDSYDYGLNKEEWDCDDSYHYYGANFNESWFIRDGGSGVAVKTDWQATTDARYNTHNLDYSAGDLFGDTPFTTNDDPYPLLAHSKLEQTWPLEWNLNSGQEEPFWPGWWADEYYGEEDQSVWSEYGIYDCSRQRSDPGCWQPLKGRHISDMDVYMEFDDRWANVGNKVLDNEYVAAGYPLGLKVMSMAHSYGVAYAEDVMFVTVKVRNESGDYCAFTKDRNENEITVRDDDGVPVCGDGMVMPDGTKINRGKGFEYNKLYLGFYMDADVLSTDATGGYSVHTNEDDYMKYIDCKISKDEYPEGCPVVNDDTLRISMAVIGDYDGISNSAYGYSMSDGQQKGNDFGVVAVQLLDSPYSTGYIDLDQDGFYDIYPGEKLKMTDWHWFDWYNRPGVKSAGASDDPAQNKELIQYQVIAGDNTNLTDVESERYFHTADPETDYDTDLNPHFDSLDGIEKTSFFTTDPDGLDCVLEMSTGPFDLKVGEEVSFSFSIIFGQNIKDLLRNAKFAQIMYNSHYQGYTPPNTPTVKAVSGHEKIDLYWNDVSDVTSDVITTYSDFQGYKIYRSSDGGVTWGSNADHIFVDGSEEGWQPLSVGCVDNLEEPGGGVCSDVNYLDQSSCEYNSNTWVYTAYDHGSKCSSFENKADCLYSDVDTFTKRDENLNNIFDCYWKYAQFDLSAYQDSLYCVLGEGVSGECNTTEDCLAPCIRGTSVEGPDPEAPWFSLGYNTGLDALKLGMQEAPYNPDSVLVDSSDSSIEYKYKFTDYTVQDGIEYTYSVVAYDGGVPAPKEAYTSLTDTTYNKLSSSIPDPNEWGIVNPFKVLESPKGTSILDPNFVQVYPGYTPQSSLNNIQVVPNPYIVSSDFNETEYKRKIRFTRLPVSCTVSIFTITGEKVRVLDHNSLTDGNLWWDLRSYNNQEIAPGLYIYVVQTPSGGKKIGKFAVVR